MRRSLCGWFAGVFVWACTATAGYAAVVSKIEVRGNTTVSTDYVLSLVKTKVGAELNQQEVSDDIKRIYDLGYFSNVDAKVVTDPSGALTLDYLVTENPVIKEIRFEGNTIYKDKVLHGLLFTKPGMTFNSVFFRNDLQRLRDRFQADGYVMTRIKDVQMNDGVVTVQLGEARVGEVVIQGNRRTKTYVIRRYFPIKTGDLFNAVTLRHSIARLRTLGFLDDVTVGFEPTDDPDVTDLILTVREKKSAALLLSVSYGSSSGFGGGVSFKESNLSGRARVLDVGFDKGDYSSYWINLSDPYMDSTTFSWKFGAYMNDNDDLIYRYDRTDQFHFDEKRTGAFAGLGRKFGHNELYSWYFTADWHKNEIQTDKYTTDNENLAGQQYKPVTPEEIQKYFVANDSLNTRVFSTTLELTRDNTDRFLPYAKGDREIIGVEKAWSFLGGEQDYTKYWAEGDFYMPLPWLQDYVKLGMTDDRPAILALRVRGADSSGSLPFSEQYGIGGARSVRGYDSSYMRGERLALANVELRVPIDDNFSLVGFYDIGRVWQAEERPRWIDPKKDSEEWLKSPGVGVRLKTPLGMIRVDVARGKDDSGSDETQYHFGFGEMF